MQYGDLTFLEIRDRARQGWVAIVPTGCTEQQGPHLPVDADTWQVQATTRAAAERAADRYGLKSLVLPTMPFGPTPEHRNFGWGYIDISAELHEALVRAVLESLGEQGFARIIVWRGCGQHDLEETVRAFNLVHTGRSMAFLPRLPFHDVWCRTADPSVPGGHADSFATSLALHLRPRTVRTDLIPELDPKHQAEWDYPVDFTRYSSTGVVGDATHASAELGARLWEAVVDEMARTFAELATADEPVVDRDPHGGAP